MLGTWAILPWFVTSYSTSAPSIRGIAWSPTLSGQSISWFMVIPTSSIGSSIRRRTEVAPSSETFLVEATETAGFFRSKAHCTKVDFPVLAAPSTARVISCIPTAFPLCPEKDGSAMTRKVWFPYQEVETDKFIPSSRLWWVAPRFKGRAQWRGQPSLSWLNVLTLPLIQVIDVLPEGQACGLLFLCDLGNQGGRFNSVLKLWPALYRGVCFLRGFWNLPIRSRFLRLPRLHHNSDVSIVHSSSGSEN